MKQSESLPIPQFLTSVTAAIALIVHLLLLCLPLMLMGRFRQIAVWPTLVTFLLLVCVWQLLESKAAPSHSGRPLQAVGPRWLPHAIGMWLLTVFWVSLMQFAIGGVTRFGPFVFIGVGLMTAGIGLRLLAIRTLGVYFLNEVALLPGQPLVTDGIYSRLRHPSELGALCLAFGGALVLSSWAGALVCAAVLTPLIIWRSRLEDALLLQRYPTAFGRYAQKAPAFFSRLSLPKRSTD